MPLFREATDLPGAEESSLLLEHGGSERKATLARLAWVAVVCWASIATYLAASSQQATAPTGAERAGRRSVVGLDEVVQGKKTAEEEEGQKQKHEKRGLYGVYEEALKKAKYIDLTHAFSPTSPVWGGFGPASFGPGKSGVDFGDFSSKDEKFTYDTHGFQVGTYTIPTDQYGTQLDPPAHFNELGATISDVPATVAVRPLVILDVHEKVAKDPAYAATMDDAKAWEEEHGSIPGGSVVFVRSDWSKGWEEYAEKGLPDGFPGVSLDLLKFLHIDRKILFHGHEPLDTDMTEALEGEAWLLHNNYLQAEGLTHLDQVPETGCLVSIGFAKPLGGLGGFARYIAICPAHTEEGVTIEEQPGAPLEQQSYPLRRDKNGVMMPDKDAKPTLYCREEPALGCLDGKATWMQP